MAILALINLESLYYQMWTRSIVGIGILGVLVAATTTLAALSDSPKRQREELALFAYGGTPWQIQARYFVRGSIVVVLGLAPVLVSQLLSSTVTALFMGSILVFVIVGATTYTIPGLRRTQSQEFVEQYKG
ncbi:MAG TPA: hypothetical protein VFV92_01905 [Candidatus Bathyarchaeia archaeon]|nr:hypothetical protein [Candidatus Bathyarchaeia archaeon]